MFKKMLLVTAIVLVSLTCVQAQDGNWTNYTNGDYITAYANTDSAYLVGTTGGFVKIDKETGVK